MPLSAKKTILVPCCISTSTDAIKHYGLSIARVFDATITIFVTGDEDVLLLLRQKLHEQIFRFCQSGTFFSTMRVMEKNEQNEEVIMVMYPEFTHRSQSLRKLMYRSRRLKLPFIVLPHSSQDGWTPQHVIMPVTYDKSDKEAAIWVSYWGRFNKSRITLFAATDKDPTTETDVNRNLFFIKKLFDSLKLIYEVKKGDTSSSHIAQEAVNTGATEGNGLIVIATTKYYSIVDCLIGSREFHLIKNNQHMPIFCVNPRKDLYVLCQ
jgi:hypothetical protein